MRDGSGRELLLTNAHVVRGAASVRVVLADGSDAELAVLGAVDGKDAALLDPSPLRGAATAAALGPSVGLGDPVVVAGHPAGSFRLDASDVVDVQRRAAYGSASDVLLVGATAEGGHSGGAVMDAAGAVVGLVAARDPGTGRVVAYRIDELLDATLGALPAAERAESGRRCGVGGSERRVDSTHEPRRASGQVGRRDDLVDHPSCDLPERLGRRSLGQCDRAAVVAAVGDR